MLAAAASLHLKSSAPPSSGSTSTGPRWPCTTPLVELQPTTLAHSPAPARGRSLALTITSAPASDVPTPTPTSETHLHHATDVAGTPSLLRLPSLPENEFFLPPTARVVIQEPVCTFTDDVWMVAVEHWSDLIRLPPVEWNERWSWREALERERWDEAVVVAGWELDRIERGEERTGGEEEVRRGRMRALEALEWWEPFTADAEALGDHEAAARGWYKQRAYSQALSSLSALAASTPTAAELHIAIHQRKQEQATGLYPLPIPDSAEYQHPSLTLQTLPGRGRGLVATAPIPAGTLLLAVPATFFAATAPPETAPWFERWHRRLTVSPREYAAVCTAVTGSYARAPDASAVDAHLLAAVLAHNAHATSPTPTGSGLWITAALINHACTPNASFATVNRMFLVHSRVALHPGDEATLAYISPLVPFPTRREKIQQQWEFTCACSLCTLEATELGATRKERQLLLDRAGDLRAMRRKAVEKLVWRLEATYVGAPAEMPRMVMARLLDADVLRGEVLEGVLDDAAVVGAVRGAWRGMVRRGLEVRVPALGGWARWEGWERRAREWWVGVEGSGEGWEQALAAWVEEVEARP
ncbi:hypothetical protein EDC01DRAFT_763070 [Geopyxis carbonaria]|nr:hypothetical protein EDC01DRAFT_763070 [Geopyxis carbonaria]